MCELSCFIMFAIISYVLLNIIAASSSLPPPMNGNILRCAAGRLCARPGRAPETRSDGTPRHHCMHCRKPICGGSCGVQWADDAERARRGFVFPITSLHPNKWPQSQVGRNSKNSSEYLFCVIKHSLTYVGYTSSRRLEENQN